MKKIKFYSAFLSVLLTLITVAPAATLADSSDLNTIYLLQAQVYSSQNIVAALLALKIGDLGNKPDEPPGQVKKITPKPTPVSASAQSIPAPTPIPATPEAQAARKDALEQIQTNLQSVQASLTVAQNIIQAQESVSGVGLNLTRMLRRGSSGDDVKQLQVFLKMFLDIYPEGLITGNFGPLTEKAVAKFQQKNGLDAVGFVGPRTRAELNRLAVISDCRQTSERPCYDKVFGGSTTKLEKSNGENAFLACMNNSSNNFRSAGQLQTLSCTKEEFFYCNEGQSGNQLRQFFGTCVAPTPIPTPTPTPIPTPTTIPVMKDPTQRIMYWWGKVNQHVDAYGYWLTDPDGVSGANLDKLTYCKKFYPNTTGVQDYMMETTDTWRNAGNLDGPFTSINMSTKCVQPTATPTLTPTPTPTPTASTATCAPIYVSISSATPPAQNVVRGQSGVPLAIFAIVADCNLSLNSFAVSLLPMPNGYQNISSLRLYNNATGALLGSTTASVAGLNFTGLTQPILSNQILFLKVVGDISPSAVIGSTVYGVFGGSSASDSAGNFVGNNASGYLIFGQTATIVAQ